MGRLLQDPSQNKGKPTQGIGNAAYYYGQGNTMTPRSTQGIGNAAMHYSGARMSSPKPTQGIGNAAYHYGQGDTMTPRPTQGVGNAAMLYGQGNQANPRPTTPTPAQDIGSVPTKGIGNAAYYYGQGGAMTPRPTQGIGNAAALYGQGNAMTPKSSKGIGNAAQHYSQMPSPTIQQEGFIGRAIGTLNSFLGREQVAALGSKVRVSDKERDYMNTKEFQSGVNTMSRSDSFTLGGVDREWARVSKDQMRQAEVSEADLTRYSMQSEPRSPYAYRGSNQIQIEQAVGMRNASQPSGDSVYIPVAKGRGDMLNQYLTSRMGKK